jgi:hypothetical protein
VPSDDSEVALRDKADRCVRIARFLFPHASDSTIENQAMALMALSEYELDQLVQRSLWRRDAIGPYQAMLDDAIDEHAIIDLPPIPTTIPMHALWDSHWHPTLVVSHIYVNEPTLDTIDAGWPEPVYTVWERLKFDL